MDSKSLAKSKRTHTLHHKKHHPNQKVKGATATATASSSAAPSGAEKAQGKVVKEKARVGPSALPSNWDRYKDEDDPITENKKDGQSSQPSDVVVPKSKGADYAYLISEAKSQNSTRLSSDIFPSLDDFVSDFGQGKESFFAARGESLLSSIQNDSFFVEDKTHANYEASFLSLNMHALAKQLSKIELSKRLFMEADLFPPEQQSDEVEEREIFISGHDNTLRNEVQPSTTTDTTTSSTCMNPPVHHHPAPNSNPKSISNSSTDQPKLEAEAAETELDMLLDSFEGGVNLQDKVSTTSTSTKNTVDFDIDSTLDDLLKETSTPSMLDQNKASHVSKSEPFDDFDSWLDTI